MIDGDAVLMLDELVPASIEATALGLHVLAKVVRADGVLWFPCNQPEPTVSKAYPLDTAYLFAEAGTVVQTQEDVQERLRIVEDDAATPLLSVNKGEQESDAFFTNNNLSPTPMSLEVYWGKRVRLKYTPDAPIRLTGPTDADIYLKKRFERVTLARQDGKKLAKTNTSYQYALRQIVAKPTLKDKVLITENLINKFRYFAEPVHAQGKAAMQEDHWMTPSEFLNPKYGGYSGGDCEYFAIYKYTLLEQAGVDPKYMQIVGLRVPSPRGFIGHAVLMVEDPENNVTYVLDSLTKPGQTPLHYNTTYIPKFYISNTHIAEF